MRQQRAGGPRLLELWAVAVMGPFDAKPFGIKKGDSLSKKRHALNVDNTRARDDPQRAGQRLAGLVWHLPRSEIGGRHLALMARPVRVYVFLPVFRAGKHSGKLG